MNKEEIRINHHRTFSLKVIAASLSFMLTGCAGITTVMPDGEETTRSREDFEKYVESVFRRQNRASLEVGQLLNDEISARDSDQFERAEGYMLKACSALNRVARQEMERNDPGILLKMEVRDTIGECDFATRILEEMIAEFK